MAERYYTCKQKDCGTSFMIDCSASELDKMKICPNCGSKNVDMDFGEGKGKNYKNFGLVWKTSGNYNATR